MFRNKFDTWTRFNADGSPGGNGGEGGSDPDRGFQRLLERNNQDGIGLARQLFSENYQYRQEVKGLKEQVQDLQGKTAPEGSIVLSGDDLKAWSAYKELGDPETVKQGLDQAKELQGKLSSMERESVLRTVAEQAGYKPGVLAQLDRMAKAQGKDLAFEVREVEQDGSQVKVPYVKDREAETPLTEYAAAEWADFLPALAVQDAPAPSTPTPPPGVRYPPQHPGGGNGPAPKSVADEFVAERDEKAKEIKNPLLPE